MGGVEVGREQLSPLILRARPIYGPRPALQPFNEDEAIERTLERRASTARSTPRSPA